MRRQHPVDLLVGGVPEEADRAAEPLGQVEPRRGLLAAARRAARVRGPCGQHGRPMQRVAIGRGSRRRSGPRPLGSVRRHRRQWGPWASRCSGRWRSTARAPAWVPRDRVVLSALAMGPRRMLTAEQLADALWGEGLPASWRRWCRAASSRLRRALGRRRDRDHRGGYRLALADDEIDAPRFERPGRARPGAARAAASPSGRRTLLERGAGAVAGQPAGGRWRGGSRGGSRPAGWRSCGCDARSCWLERALRAGEHVGARRRAGAGAPRSRCGSGAGRLLARGAVPGRAGRPRRCARAARAARGCWPNELGLDPGPELVGARAGDPAPGPRRWPLPARRCRPPACARTRAAALRRRRRRQVLRPRRATSRPACGGCATAGVLAVVGPSGCGKSSLVRAGVVAALRRAGGTGRA